MGLNRYVIGSVFVSFLSAACAHQGPETEAVTNPSTGEVIKKADIEGRATGLSPMPEGMGEILSKRELRDLVEFLAGQN